MPARSEVIAMLSINKIIPTYRKCERAEGIIGKDCSTEKLLGIHMKVSPNTVLPSVLEGLIFGNAKQEKNNLELSRSLLFSLIFYLPFTIYLPLPLLTTSLNPIFVNYNLKR